MPFVPASASERVPCAGELTTAGAQRAGQYRRATETASYLACTHGIRIHHIIPSQDEWGRNT
jgi:hypothetical protein